VGSKWCQAKVIQVGNDDYRYAKDWRKVISTMTSGSRYWHQPTMQEDMYHTIGLCLLAECRGLPILQEYAMRLVGASNRIIKDFANSSDSMFYYAKSHHSVEELKNLKPEPITDLARTTYAAAFDTDLDEQYDIEETLRNWDLPVGVPVSRPVEIYGDWVIDCHPLDEI